jgi:hypothetical protein
MQMVPEAETPDIRNCVKFGSRGFQQLRSERHRGFEASAETLNQSAENLRKGWDAQGF